MKKRQARYVRHALGMIMAAASPLPLMAQTVPASAPNPGTTAPATEEPILPDDEFNARLPGAGSLDNKADNKAPLPSIDDWLDQQMPAQSNDQSSAPATGTASATGAKLPPATEPPVETELAQPLPALDSVTVPENVADDDNSEKTPEIRYATQLDGFGKTGLEDEFRAASALLDGKGTAETASIDRKSVV